MISIQELGTEILTKNPRKFYVWLGSEQGIKEKYLSILAEHYGDRKDVDSVSEVFNLMQTKRLIPLRDCLYIVRYDDAFYSSLNDKTEKQLSQINIRGTIVCLYDSDKLVNRFEKYVPSCTAYIDSVDRKFIEKYLKSEFPDVCDRFLKFASIHALNYSHARNMTRCVSKLDQKVIISLSDEELLHLFSVTSKFNEKQFQQAVANKSFVRCTSLLSNYEGSVDEVIYIIMRTMLELEKLFCYPSQSSPLYPYLKKWTLEDIYNLFCHAYAEIKRIRSISCDPDDSLQYLLSMLAFKKIPTMGALKWI